MDFKTCGSECAELVKEVYTVLKWIYHRHPETSLAASQDEVNNVQYHPVVDEMRLVNDTTKITTDGRTSVSMIVQRHGRKRAPRLGVDPEDTRHIIFSQSIEREEYFENDTWTLVNYNLSDSVNSTHSHRPALGLMRSIENFERELRAELEKGLDALQIPPEARDYKLISARRTPQE